MALVTADLVYEWVAKLATGAGPGVNGGSPTTTWVANVGSNNITLRNTGGDFAWNDSGSGWDGDGSAGDPYCLCADGTGDYGTFASAFVTSDADFTIEMWTYMGSGPPAANSSFFYNLGGAAYTGLRYYVTSTNGYSQWALGKGSVSYTYPSNLTVGYGASWQHKVLTYNAATDYATTYDNAAGDTPVSTTFGPYTGTCRLFATDASMNAMKLATLRVYSACLSAADILANYDAGVTAASTDSGFTGMRVTHHITA